VLKIDAEATEAKVIRGGRETLRRHRPFVICEVLDNVDHEFVERTFMDLSYDFYHIGPRWLQRRVVLRGSLAEDQRNYLFVPEEKVDALQQLPSLSASEGPFAGAQARTVLDGGA
jgi:methyltransferase FkbM-like protein